MGRLVAQLRAFAFALGPPGLALIAFVDSSFLSLPEVADLLVVAMVTQHKALWPVYVLSATAGSVAGCLVIYYIGLKGGEALVRRRIQSATVDRAKRALQRHGVVAVMVPAVLPPPVPFKPFVLLAGLAEISPLRFALAVAIARGGRYLALGLLALRFGDQAMEYMREHLAFVSLLLIGVLAAAAVVYLVWARSIANAGRQP
jgi:membrane protein YqaA with SNARE-associated domain